VYIQEQPEIKQGGVGNSLNQKLAYALSMFKKFLPFLALVSVGSYLAGRYDLWWVAVIYSGTLFWLFYIRK
jgi:hypothetical protein